MSYRVVKYFTDLQDNDYAYHVGDKFPHDGMTVSEERLIELSSDKNRRGTPLIEKVEEISEETVEPEPKVETVEEPVAEPEVKAEAPKKPAKRSKKVEKENKDAE